LITGKTGTGMSWRRSITPTSAGVATTTEHTRSCSAEGRPRSRSTRSTSRPSRSSKERPSTLRCRRRSSSALAMPVSPSASSRS
jgi:hypothetical protein